MSRDQLPDVTVDDDETFEALLAELVELADNAGVEVCGAWSFETRGSIHNWEVEIVELANDKGQNE